MLTELNGRKTMLSKRITTREINEALARVQESIPALERLWREDFKVEDGLACRAFWTEYNGLALECTFWGHRWVEYVTRKDMALHGSAIVACRVGARQLRARIRQERKDLLRWDAPDEDVEAPWEGFDEFGWMSDVDREAREHLEAINHDWA